MHDICETPECVAQNYSITRRADAIMKGVYKARTQKAAGYLTLSGQSRLQVPGPFYIVSDLNDIAPILQEHSYGKRYMVRPCPKRARHGFVESRPITVHQDEETASAIAAIFAEAQEADSDAELLLCPLINAKANCVVTPGFVSIGPGHDGATSGRGAIGFPLVGAPFAEIGVDILQKSGVEDTQAPYLEAVMSQTYPDSNWHFTQLRAGPKVAGLEHDFIPSLTKVESILEASGDLLEWEKQMETIAPGVVVVHPGGSLVSHYGVHCIINKIPIMTSRVPMVGEWLEKEPKDDVRVPDPQAVLKGLAIGTQIELLDIRNREKFLNDGTMKDKWTVMPSPAHMIDLMLVVAHNAPAMSNGYGVWLGVAAATMLRCGMAASHGEARHRSPLTKNISRETIFHTTFSDFFGARNTLHIAQESFMYDYWTSGYGGKKWEACTQSIIDLDGVVVKLFANPTDALVAELMEKLNKAVDQAHNNGWWLNKFTGMEEDAPFQQAAEQSVKRIVKAAETALMLAPHLTEDVEETLRLWREQTAIVLRERVEYFPKKAGDLDEDEINDDDPCDDDNDELISITGEDEEESSDMSDFVEGCDCAECKKHAVPETTDHEDAVEPVKTVVKSSKLSKIPFNPLKHSISRGHLRYEWMAEKTFRVHIQFELMDKNEVVVGYCSTDASYTHPIQPIRDIIEKHPSEESYSSGAMGYYPLEVSPGIIIEPLCSLAAVLHGVTLGLATLDGKELS